MAAWLLFTLSALASDFAGEDKQGHPTRAVLLGGSGDGQSNAALSAGTPWTTATLHHGLRGGWTPLVEVQTASFARWQPAVGVGKRWLDRRWRITGEGTLGWTLQGDPIPFRGPAAELRVKGGRAVGRFAPYLHLGVRGSRTEDRTETVSGEVLRASARWETTLTGALGTGFLLTDRWGLDAGLDLPWVNVPNPSIPGIHLGVHTGWGRSR
jgi:hypothetical protein